ncbi:hypothetical protein HK096_001775 [Nowakowskiella sp. JEL0078]|nr:hypothetical protein HK096_001775 [Nowakowskiella sp. JEL0078]
MRFIALISLTAIFTLSFITSVDAAVISHDAVVGFAEITPVTGEEISAKKFKAYMHIINGCAVFPSVDASGNVGGGLKVGGAMNGKCESSPGQVYVRSTWYNGRWAIMYSWYWPKDQNIGGHRHDWESAVVWINNPDVSVQNVIGVSASAHGDYRKYNPAPSSIFDGNHPQIKYFANGVYDHALDTYDYATGESPVLPLIHWHQLTQAARDTLTNYDYGSANVPFKDSNFLNNLALAYL